MVLEKLSKRQIKSVYSKYLKRDFPPDETKPLGAILKAVRAGSYECLGLKPDSVAQLNEFLGYVFLVKQGGNYLIDYLATVREKRNQGLGASLLELLGGYLSDADCVIAEVEDPAYTENREEKELQTRRLGFYLRNGFRDTQVRARAFGVDFIIIEKPVAREHTAQEIKEQYRAMYRVMLPEIVFKKTVKIKE